MADDFTMDIGVASLLGVIGGKISRHPDVLDVRPVVSNDSHEIVAMKVETIHGVFEVKVEPAE